MVVRPIALLRSLFDELFDPLSRGENVLPSLHAYTHVNAMCSAAKAYLVLGDEKYLRAALHGFRFVDEQSYATGGWGPHERFVPIREDIKEKIPAIANLYDSLEKTGASFETPCGSWAHFKLTRYLLRITKDSKYGDSMERVMYNSALDATPLQPDGRTFYYSNYSPLLLRNIAANCGRISHLYVFLRYTRSVRQSLHSIDITLEAGRHGCFLESEGNLSFRRCHSL